MGDKATFNSRLDSLRLDVNALKEVRIHVSQLHQGRVTGIKPHTIPNEQGKQGSLQVYASIATNDGYIGPTEAQRGLEVFGQELRQDARANLKKWICLLFILARAILVGVFLKILNLAG